MHPLYRRLDRRHRRLFALANAAMVLGLTPLIFRESIPVNHNWLDGLCGFFMGLNITINVYCLRAARNCGRDRA